MNGIIKGKAKHNITANIAIQLQIGTTATIPITVANTLSQNEYLEIAYFI